MSEPSSGSRRASKRVPLVVIAVVFGLAGVAILRDRVAAVDEWIGKAFFPSRWQAAETCRQHLVSARSELRFPRLLERGQVHPTEGGYLVNEIVVGYMAESGAETYATFSCYLDKAGNVVKTAGQRHSPSEAGHAQLPHSPEGQ